MRPVLRFSTFVSVLALLGAHPARSAGASQEKNHASWWITNYGLVDTTQQSLAARAEPVFDRVAAAADKRANRLPRLAILDAEGSPFAMALPDGTVLLTRGALRICYKDVPDEIGDARLAFVIGHELSHLSNDDFWHAAAFDAVKVHGATEPTRATIEGILEGSLRDGVRRELQADAYGMLYMTSAGYDPNVLLRNESFFDEWAAELDALGVRTAASHPGPAERAAFIGTQLAAIADDLDFFRFGVRLVQLGRFQDGLLLLGRFRDRFASREVLNNIGVAHFQLAARYLGNCDGRLVVRFKLPTVIDPSTRAAHLRSGGSGSSCVESERFQLHYREAERNLKEATEMDPKYGPSRLNLLSLYALSSQGAQAIVAAEDARGIMPEDPRLRSGSAVALYLYGEQSGFEMADTAIEQLQSLFRSHPESKEAAYNLAAMLSERRRVQAAEHHYRAFLALEQQGIYADAARGYLGEPRDASHREATAIEAPPVPPLAPGPLDHDELAALPNSKLDAFVIGDFNGAFIQFDGGRALVIDEIIELVEEDIEGVGSEPRDRFGPPGREQITAVGRILFYERFAIEVAEGRAQRRLFY